MVHYWYYSILDIVGVNTPDSSVNFCVDDIISKDNKSMGGRKVHFKAIYHVEAMVMNLRISSFSDAIFESSAQLT